MKNETKEITNILLIPNKKPKAAISFTSPNPMPSFLNIASARRPKPQNIAPPQIAPNIYEYHIFEFNAKFIIPRQMIAICDSSGIS
ncbi:hypothetical protein D3C73_1407980 [compost metagenome]